MAQVAMIPADNQGNFLYIKDVRIDEKGIVWGKYKSTYNDIPFRETILTPTDMGQTFSICGDDGTVIFRFSAQWIEKIY